MGRRQHTSERGPDELLVELGAHVLCPDVAEAPTCNPVTGSPTDTTYSVCWGPAARLRSRRR